jgi:hypothetical protein
MERQAHTADETSTLMVFYSLASIAWVCKQNLPCPLLFLMASGIALRFLYLGFQCSL